MNKIVKLICTFNMILLFVAASVTPTLEAARDSQGYRKSPTTVKRNRRLAVRTAAKKSHKNRRNSPQRRAARIVFARNGNRQRPSSRPVVKRTTVRIEMPANPTRAHTTTIQPANSNHLRPQTPATPTQNPEKQRAFVYTPPAIHAADAAEMGRKALDYTNQFRATQGLPPLQWNQSLADAGLIHSQNMGNGAVAWGHGGFHERIQSLPFRSRAAAENLYMCNHRSGQATLAVEGWIKSPGHLKNLVGNYTHCGIGVYKNSKGYWYFTQLFATPV